MCKMISLTNVSKVKNLNKLTKAACDLVSESEVDGFGYAIQGKDGIFGERTTSPENFEPSFDKPILSVDFVKHGYNRFGKESTGKGGAIFHGRTSTNSKTLLNTHPIVKHGWTLIHNGVVSNHGTGYEMLTSNDTEHIVENMATIGISGVEANLTGYYAFCAFNPKNEMHIVRDSIAGLFAGYVASIDSFIFATSERHILAICKAMKWTSSVVESVEENRHLIFNNGKLVSSQTIKPRGRTSYENKYASLSLGREISEDVEPWSTEKQDEDEIMFLEEMSKHADDSYTIEDYRGDKITISQFKDLSDEEKLYCYVIRPDGTVCDQNDYATEKLGNFSGRVA